MKKTDSEIQQAVLRELKWDTRVEETGIGVEVDRGVVTLTGAVSSWAKRMAAQEAAHRVGGVLTSATTFTWFPVAQGEPIRTSLEQYGRRSSGTCSRLRRASAPPSPTVG